MISATEQPWNSATTLYIARKLQEIAKEKDKQLTVLDLGCGNGHMVKTFGEYGHDMYGYDNNERLLRENLEPVFGDDFENRIKFMTDDRVIPFEDNLFDVVYANQVFEHVRFLDQIIAECARILKSGGILVTLFPLATYPLEGHCKIPFAHWLPPGEFRRQYLSMYFRLRLRPKLDGKNSYETGSYWDGALKNYTYYRFLNEVSAISDYYFESFEIDTRPYIKAKLDLLATNPTFFRQTVKTVGTLLQGKMLDYVVTHFWGGTFCMRNPRPPSEGGTPYYK